MPDILPTATPGRTIRADATSVYIVHPPAAAIVNVPPAAASPTKAEYDLLATRFNALLDACRALGVILP